jgi:hypothetical protein
MRWKIIVGMALVSCSPKPHAVLEKNPHILFADKSKREISQKIRADLIYKGYDLKDANDSELSFEKHRLDVGSPEIAGSEYDPRNKELIRFSLSETGSGTQVIGSMHIVSGTGGPLERKSDFSLTGTGKTIQTYLDDVKTEFEMDTLGKIGVMVDSAGRIMGITHKSGAFEAGLIAGDSIIRIDSVPVPIGNPRAIARAIAGPPDSKVRIEFIRNGEEKSALVLRKKL